MQHTFTDWDDTIVALATAQGIGAIGVIRLSGTKAIEIVDRMMPHTNLLKQASHTIHYSTLMDGDILLDEVVVSLYKNPKSYTGEDIVEISCHGSPYVQQQIINACMAKGARAAKAGEFTLRAFLNKKLDLTQAEAVADVIAANSEKAKQIALNQLRGGFANKLDILRNELIQFAALLELELDFAEEDVEFADRSSFLNTIEKMEAELLPLLQSFKVGNAIKNGIPVAIVGKPNAGKSTLLNALLQEERAIVSDIAGTTRDTIEDSISLAGLLFRFIDTAGLRDTQDVIEKVGVARAMQKISEAQLVMYIADVAEDYKEIVAAFNELPIQKHQQALIVLNKIDAGSSCDAYDIEEAIATLTQTETIAIAAKTMQHVDKLIAKIIALSNIGNIGKEDTIITNARHYNELEQTLQSLHSIKQGFQQNLSGDLIAVDVRKALGHIAAITGNVEQDRDILGTIFGKFCIGK